MNTVLTLLRELLPFLLLAIPAGAVASVLFQWIKRTWATVDGLNAWTKRLVIFVAGSLLVWVGSLLGVPIGLEPGANPFTSLDESTVRLLVDAALAWIVAKFTHSTFLQSRRV